MIGQALRNTIYNLHTGHVVGAELEDPGPVGGTELGEGDGHDILDGHVALLHTLRVVLLAEPIVLHEKGVDEYRVPRKLGYFHFKKQAKGPDFAIRRLKIVFAGRDRFSL